MQCHCVPAAKMFNMKIPIKYQVFDTNIVISSKDEERLARYLSGWMPLTAVMADINEPDLKCLLVLELMGKQRWKFLDRLLGRINRIQRNRVEEKILKCLPRRKTKTKCQKKSR